MAKDKRGRPLKLRLNDEPDDIVIVFTDAYFAHGCNATKAARAIGFTGNAFELRRRPDVRARIAARLSEHKAGADEVLGVLSMHLRADLGLLVDEDGQFDWGRAQELNITRTIKKIKIRERRYKDTDGDEVVERNYEVETYDAQAAANKIANILGLEQKPKENESDAERKLRMYEKLVDRLIERAANEYGETLTRIEAINQIAAYQPEITDYIC